MRKQAIVVHSGGMDSSICLAEAIQDFGVEQVLSLSFCYGQRHARELEAADKICKNWGVDHVTLQIDCLAQITENALTHSQIPIEHLSNQEPSTLVEGRNGLMTRLACIHAKSLGARAIYLGVIEVEEANSGYRDCSRRYMDLMQEIMRLDLGLPELEIRTPLVFMTKSETLEHAFQLGVLSYLLEGTITCYEGVPRKGCGQCPACLLRNEGLMEFLSNHPEFEAPYRL